jgi:hypothetical protein
MAVGMARISGRINAPLAALCRVSVSKALVVSLSLVRGVYSKVYRGWSFDMIITRDSITCRRSKYIRPIRKFVHILQYCRCGSSLWVRVRSSFDVGCAIAIVRVPPPRPNYQCGS